jgi:hypothetical protein
MTPLAAQSEFCAHSMGMAPPSAGLSQPLPKVVQSWSK